MTCHETLLIFNQVYTPVKHASNYRRVNFNLDFFVKMLKVTKLEGRSVALQQSEKVDFGH